MDKHNREILQLAIPSIVSNMTVPLLGLADVAIAGHIGDASYIGAIAIGSMIFNIIYWVFGFLRMGTSGMTSQALGRRDIPEMTGLLMRSLFVGVSVAACFLLLQTPLRTAALALMNTPQETVPLVREYFDIVIWGAPAMLGLYAMSGWFIGMQNTRAPMVVAIIQNIVNVVVSLILVFVLGMEIRGVAAGTLTAQWTGFIIACAIWKTHYGKLATRRFCGCSMRRLVSVTFTSGNEKWKEFFTVNRDIFLRTLFIVSVNMFFTSAGASMGATVLAVNTLLMTLFTLFAYIMDGFAYAGEALSGKYYGARNIIAFRDVVKKIFTWGVLASILFTSVYIAGGNDFLRLLTNDDSVIAASEEYLAWAYAIPAAGVAAFVFDGVFIGVTATRGMLLSSAIATAVFFMTYYTLQDDFHNHALWLAFIVYLAIRGLVQALLYIKIRNI